MRRSPLARVLVAVVACALVLAAAPAAHAAGTPTRSELALLRAINEARSARGLVPVRLRWPLQPRSHAYAQTLMARDRFVHASLPRGVRENLALGTVGRMGPRSVVRMWLSSPAHRATLLWPGARSVGVGIARGKFGGYSKMRVAVSRFSAF